MSSLPVSRRHALVVASVLLALLALAGRTLAGAGGATAEPAAALVPERSQSAAAAQRLTVHVAGAVRRPGLYRLAEGKRVADAVARAGGATAKADTAAINLAAPLADGIQVLVPRRVVVAAGSAAAGSSESGSTAAGPVSLSSATVEQLDALPGVGPVTAQKIIDYRAEHGGFRSVDDLDAIPGIGPARLEQLRDVVMP
jgi:competence protein ComEA